MKTPNRSAGRLDDETWGLFLAWARWRELSNSDAMRDLIETYCIIPPEQAVRGRHRRDNVDDATAAHGPGAAVQG